MTKYLSQLLGAREPTFSQEIQRLERAGGLPSADIRLSTEMQQRTRQKIAELGLDPADTTGPELYNALHERLRADEAQVRLALGVPQGATAAQVLSSVQHFLGDSKQTDQCYALKTSVAKRLLRKKPPKTAMKRLGYRSLESMLKHEPPAQLYAVAAMTESATWNNSFRAQYAKLRPTDFEMRPMTILFPKTKKWEGLAAEFVDSTHQNILWYKELGSVVLLPIDQQLDGLATTTLLLVLEHLNDIRAYSSYAKLQQVKPQFGTIMRQASVSEPLTNAQLAGQTVPWKMIQRYYGRFEHAYHPEVFEPHVQPEDLRWQSGEAILASLTPTLTFWNNTQALGILDAEGQPVSMNALDVALGYCNHLPFQDRIVHFLRDNVWHELMMRYLHQANLEEAVHRQLSNELVEETALAET